jgi:hypothetical protein
MNPPEDYMYGFAEGYSAGYEDGKADMEWYLSELLKDCE